MTQVFFSIIIPTYNNLQELINCLESVKGLNWENIEVIISIDGSTDGTFEYLKQNQEFANYNIVFNQENRGRGAARNAGLNVANSDYLLFVDSDMKLQPDLILKHYEVLKDDLFVVSQGFVKYDKKDEFGIYAESRGKGKFENKALLEKKYLNTGNVATSKVLAMKALFDENAPYGEDLIWAFDLEKQAKFKLINNKDAIVFSNSNVSLDKALKRYFELGAVFMPYVLSKYPHKKEVFELEKYNNFIFRFITIKPLQQIIRKTYFFYPLIIKNKCIHYLLFCKLYSGLKNAKLI